MLYIPASWAAVSTSQIYNLTQDLWRELDNETPVNYQVQVSIEMKLKNLTNGKVFPC